MRGDVGLLVASVQNPGGRGIPRRFRDLSLSGRDGASRRPRGLARKRPAQRLRVREPGRSADNSSPGPFRTFPRNPLFRSGCSVVTEAARWTEASGSVLPLPEPVPVPEVGVVLPETGSQPEEGNVVTKFWRIANRPAGMVPLPEIVRSSVALHWSRFLQSSRDYSPRRRYRRTPTRRGPIPAGTRSPGSPRKPTVFACWPLRTPRLFK